MSPRALALGLVLLGLAPLPSHARRQPAAGGDVTVALPAALRAATREALQLLPLAEADDPSISPTVRAARPMVPGTPVRSHVFSGISSRDDGLTWTLTAHGVIPGLEESVDACLSARDEPRPWPGQALSAAGVIATVSADGVDTSVRFSTPVSVLPELLTGCVLRAGAAPTGPFAASGRGPLVARSSAAGGRPLIDSVSFVDEGSPSDVSLGDPGHEGGGLLVAPWPDVLLLVFDEEARQADPLGLGQRGDELVRFQRELAPELLLAVRHGGRGAGARALLPPGVGPDRPLVGVREQAPRLPLQLRSLPDAAPTLALEVPKADPLAGGVADRLALMLRARGWATGPGRDPGPTARIIRWRPAVADPGLALLVLADLVPTLIVEPASAAALLAGTRSERASAALTVERAWITDRRAVPLLTASRWLVLHPQLRGVRMRGDGVPLLDDASWSAP